MAWALRASVTASPGASARMAPFCAEALLAAKVRGQQGQALDDETGGVDLVGLHILAVDAVVADVRVRQGDDLLAIAGVGEDFLIAGDGRVEHHLANGGALGANG